MQAPTTNKKRVWVKRPSKEELERLLSQNTLAEAAKIFGVHLNTVGGWKKSLGITVKKGKAPIPLGFKEFCKNHTRKETAEHFGINYEVVRDMERRCGAKCSRRSSKKLEQQGDIPILLKYFSVAEVAERLDISDTTVRNWTKEK